MLCAICGLIASLLTAQENILSPLTNDAFCRPGVINKSPSKGVLFEYGIQPNYNISTSTNTGMSSQIQHNRQWLFKFKVPVIRKPGFKFLLGAEHRQERLNFNFISRGDASLFSDLDDKRLKASRISAYFLKSLNDKWYASLKLETAANGDYSQLMSFDNRYAIYRAAFMVARKKRDDLEYGMGVLFNKNFRRTLVVPFFLYNQTFNSKWGIESALPVKIKLRHNINERSILLFGPAFRGRTYSVDIRDDNGENGIFHLRNAELQLELSYQYRLNSWIWTEFRGGYAHPFATRFERQTGEFSAFSEGVNEINAQPTGAPFFRIGIFVSPPKHLMK